MNRAKPCIVAVSACRKNVGDRFQHMVQEKYVAALSVAAGAMPMILPALGRALDADALLARVDGLLLTGSPSNVLPRHYGGPKSAPGTLHDPHRDETTLPLVRGALENGVPLLGLCRGFQEINVALGGTLHQEVHEQPGNLDHREAAGESLDVQYGPAHAVTLTPDGKLARIVGTDSIQVNSLHGQGIEKLATDLEVEATAPDGLVEAFSATAAPAFALAVQWHPEWHALSDPPSAALFRAFGDACRERAGRR